jgi:hypothetical protein
MTAKRELRTVRLELEAGFSSAQLLRANTDGLLELDKALGHSARNYFVVGYGATRRLNVGGSGLKRVSGFESLRAQSVATLFDTDASLISLEDWALNLDYDLQQSDVALDVMHNVFAALLPNIEFHGLDRRKRRLMFKTDSGLVPLSALSDGYQAAIAWIGDLLYRILQTFEDYQSPLSARGLLLVDELDLHLHPNWQRRLFDFLNNNLKHLQIVTTTHSVLTAQQLEAGSLFTVARDQSEVQILPFHGDPSAMLVNQLLMTDAFKVSSDESYRIENAKSQYRVLRDKPSLSATEQTDLAKVKLELEQVVSGGRSNQVLSTEQYEILQRLDQKLSGLK